MSAGLTAAGKYAATYLPMGALHVVSILISFGVVMVLFAMMFKWLPDVSVGWRDVWLGAFLTALFFEVGKAAIGFYIGKQGLESTYGATASIVVVLIWVYYTSQIILRGAEGTHSYANHSGSLKWRDLGEESWGRGASCAARAGVRGAANEVTPPQPTFRQTCRPDEQIWSLLRARTLVGTPRPYPVDLPWRMTMPILEDLEGYAERATGLRRPGKPNVPEHVQARKPHAAPFKDDGLVPNHPRWPLIIYRGTVDLDDRHDRAAVIEDLFEANGWGDTWRDGIYDYVHYHSRIHEVLGIARGKGRVRFGGNKGRIFTLKAGDVAVLPAGTGHQCLSADNEFLVIGAYPPTGASDECTTVEDHPRALKTIRKVPLPRKDTVYGAGGPLPKLWKRAK